MKVLSMEENHGFFQGDDLWDVFLLCERLPLLVPIVYSTRWKFRVRLTGDQHLVLVPAGRSFRIGLDTVNEDNAIPHTLNAADIFEMLKFDLVSRHEKDFVLAAIRHLQSAARDIRRKAVAA